MIERQTPKSTGILEIIYQYEAFTDLWNFCLEKVCEEPKILFNSNNFINLKAPLLELLLKRDDLNVDEIKICDSLFKWFASWIDKKDSSHYNKKYIPYDFKLLYRSNRDGIGIDSFIEIVTIWELLFG